MLNEPVNVQHLFASKLLSYTAFRASVPWAPEIQIVLVTLLTCAVTLAVALSPTHPLGPEVFAVSAYGAWWAGTLLFLVPLWRCGRQGWRWFYVLFGGMSSRSSCRLRAFSCCAQPLIVLLRNG